VTAITITEELKAYLTKTEIRGGLEKKLAHFLYAL